MDMKKTINELVNTINANLIKMNSNNANQNQFKAEFEGQQCKLYNNKDIYMSGSINQIYNELMAFLPLTK
jgi:hypothetical protein